MEIRISPEIMAVLRNKCGYTVEEIAKKLRIPVEKLEEMEASKRNYTWSQIKKLADIYKVPLIIFFSEKIDDVPSVPDYRINRDKQLKSGVFLAIRRANFLSDEISRISNIESTIPTFEDMPPDELAIRFRAFLEPEPPTTKSTSEILEYYKNLLEKRLQIIIIEYPLKANDVRAFSILSRVSLIVLNESDRPQVRLFSLFHEVAHLLLRKHGICSIDPTHEIDATEKYCNKFAAEFLVPTAKITDSIADKEYFVDQEITKLARKYHVSTQVMMLKLLNLEYISTRQYREFKSRFDVKKIKKSGGRRNWEQTYAKRVGNLVLDKVYDAYRAGVISFFESTKILDVSLKYAAILLG
ncbi:MAG: XRE family transcriptional regulator [Candidatus Thorarchaeota archaeon]|nr:XRE family transcriptional regulator [Candidatus Thorarchaeota archaeon]